MADALHDAALGLNAGKRRVDRDAAVDNRHIVDDLDLSGQLIQLDFHHADHIRRR